MIIRPAKRIEGEVRVPGDKSISHRAVMLGSIADGDVRITNFAGSADCLATIRCMRALGVKIEVDGTSVLVHGVGLHGLRAPAEPLDCGNSGTTMRLLAGILAGQPFDSVLTGDESLQSRPMKRIIEPLSLMGAAIESEGGRAPLRFKGSQTLRGIEYTPPIASAQVKSCVLLAGLYAESETTIIESTPTRDHTERMLRSFGVDVAVSDDRRSVTGGDRLAAVDIIVPGDISSAAYFLVVAACLPNAQVKLPNVGVNPTRDAVLQVLQQIGANLSIDIEAGNGEPTATISVTAGLKAERTLLLDGPVIANLIDEIPVLAVLGTQLEHGIEVSDAKELRVKESDRINSIVTNLKLMGADVTEREDGFVVKRSNLKGARLDSFGDHRIAMAFAVAALLAEGESEIVGAECADVSFPGFFDTLERVAIR